MVGLQLPISILEEQRRAESVAIRVPVPSSDHVAEIVGRQGYKIKELRMKTNTYIRTPVRGEEPVFVITGMPEGVKDARMKIEEDSRHFTEIRAVRRRNSLTSTPLPGQVTEFVPVDQRYVGLVIGPKGSTIKRIQVDTHTIIMTPERLIPNPEFKITGTPENVQKASQLILEHIKARLNSAVTTSASTCTQSTMSPSCFGDSALAMRIQQSKDFLSQPGSFGDFLSLLNNFGGQLDMPSPNAIPATQNLSANLLSSFCVNEGSGDFDGEKYLAASVNRPGSTTSSCGYVNTNSGGSTNYSRSSSSGYVDSFSGMTLSDHPSPCSDGFSPTLPPYPHQANASSSQLHNQFRWGMSEACIDNTARPSSLAVQPKFLYPAQQQCPKFRPDGINLKNGDFSPFSDSLLAYGGCLSLPPMASQHSHQINMAASSIPFANGGGTGVFGSRGMFNEDLLSKACLGKNRAPPAGQSFVNGVTSATAYYGLSSMGGGKSSSSGLDSCGSSSPSPTDSIGTPTPWSSRPMCLMCRNREAIAELMPCRCNLFCMDCAQCILARGRNACPSCGTAATQANVVRS